MGLILTKIDNDPLFPGVNMPQQPKSQVTHAIHERRSIRHFLDAPVDRKLIMEALQAAAWAPSGLNNQPWRFALIWDNDLKEKLAGLTRYSSTLRGAAVLVLVFSIGKTPMIM